MTPTALAKLVERALRGSLDAVDEFLLHDALQTRPALAAKLPDVADAPVRARATIAHLHYIAIRARNDIAAAHAFLDSMATLGVAPSFALDGMTRDPGLDRWVGVVARSLDDAEPELRRQALWVLGFAARRKATELAPHAEALLRCAIDRVKAGPKLVATEARPVLEAAVAQTKDRPRFVEAARDLLRDLDATQAKDLRDVLRKILPEALAKVAAERAAQNRVLDEMPFLAAVDAAPDDDGPRLVYADALLEIGDPRGELILLQCARARTGERPHPRETALLRTHTRTWLGAAFDHLEAASIVLERGFLVAGTLAGRGLRAKWPRTAEPAWRTLERLDVGRALVEEDEIVPAALLPRLRTLVGLEHPMLRNVTRTDLEHLGFRTFDPDAALPLLERHRCLHVITVPDSRLDALTRKLGAALPTVTTLASPRRVFVRTGGKWTPDAAVAASRRV